MHAFKSKISDKNKKLKDAFEKVFYFLHASFAKSKCFGTFLSMGGYFFLTAPLAADSPREMTPSVKIRTIPPPFSPYFVGE